MKQRLQKAKGAPKPEGEFCDSVLSINMRAEIVWVQGGTGYCQTAPPCRRGLHVTAVSTFRARKSQPSSPVPYSLVKLHFVSLQTFIICPRETEVGSRGISAASELASYHLAHGGRCYQVENTKVSKGSGRTHPKVCPCHTWSGPLGIEDQSCPFLESSWQNISRSLQRMLTIFVLSSCSSSPSSSPSLHCLSPAPHFLCCLKKSVPQSWPNRRKRPREFNLHFAVLLGGHQLKTTKP